MFGFTFSFKKIISIFALLALAYTSWLMLEICVSYFPWQDDTGFLALKQDVVHFMPWRVAFIVHVCMSMFVLLAGFTQFWTAFRLRFPKWHRRLGYVYVITVLAFAAPSGALMAVYASGRLPTQISFGILTVLWVIFTVLAVRRAYQKKWLAHRDWMIRSYALSLSALTLRSWKLILYALAPYFEWLTPRHIYQLEAWLGWGVNLLIAEIIIFYLAHQHLKKKNTPLKMKP